MSRPSNPPPPSADAAGVVIGLDNIAGLFGRSRCALKRWVASDEFPAAQLPDGTYVSTVRLIDRWIAERAATQREEQ